MLRVTTNNEPLTTNVNIMFHPTPRPARYPATLDFDMGLVRQIIVVDI